MKYAVELLVTIFFLFSFLRSSLSPFLSSFLMFFPLPFSLFSFLSPHPFFPPSLFSPPPSLYSLPHLSPPPATIPFSPSHISLCLSCVITLFIKLSHACTNQCYPSSNCLHKNAVPPFLFSPPTAFPLTLVLSISVPVGTVLVAVVLLLLCLCCVLCMRRHAQIGKHTPLMEERAFEKQRKKEKQRQKT